MDVEDGIAEAEGEGYYLEHRGKSSARFQKYVEGWWLNLVSLEIDREKGQKIDSCGEGYVLKKCCSDEKHPVKKYKMTCKDDLCPVCSEKRHKDRVMSAWRRIEHIGGRWWHMVFTIPSDWWYELRRDDPDLKGVMRAIRLCLGQVFGGKVGVMMVRHRFSSMRPWEELYHVHVLVSSKYITDKGAVREKGWFKMDELLDMRRRYVVCVNEELGWDMGGCSTGDGLPIINVQYADKWKVRSHTLRYLLRNPVDFGSFGFDGEDVWYDTGSKLGQVFVSPKTFSGVFRFYLKGLHRAVWFGWLGYNSAKKYAFVGVRRRVDHEREEVCEVCGAKMFTYELSGPGVYWCVEDT